ncbi:MAG TPA: sigma-54 dependent transcriptional regulator [bacterium]|nr:sigma-54 dependent transcriptional regulator [bacterium]
MLLIEEQAEALSLLLGMAEENGWRLESASDPVQAEQWMQRHVFQVAVLDLRMAEGNGESLLARMKQAWPMTQFIVITPAGDAQRGLRALKLGAYDSVSLPHERDALEAAVKRACERARFGSDTRAARLRDDSKPALLGGSATAQRLRDSLAKAAGHEANVLLVGEPGTGKSLAARFIHRQSARRKGPFVILDCVKQSPEQEQELFGRASEPGILELGAGGIVLLAHVEFLQTRAQAKLLRALQDRGFTAEGGERFVPLEARVLATSGPALRDRVKEGSFREDLYWSLGSTPLELPPLRSRPEDIEEIFRNFLETRCAQIGRALPALRPETLAAIRAHSFPGNIGELEALAHLVADLAHEDVGLADLPVPVFVEDRDDQKSLPLKSLVHAFERHVILRTLKAVRGNQSRAAERLQVHRNTLILKMQELEIPNKRTQKKTRVKQRG